jgi:hypothetical protein
MSNHNSPFFYNDNNPSFTPFSTTFEDKSLFPINWNEILLKPSFSNICFSANYNDLTNIPNLSLYASNNDVSNISNLLYDSSSNSNINVSNSLVNFTNNKIGTIRTSQWTSDINSNIYYNDGNVGIGSSVFNSDKLIVLGNINSDEYKIKDLNISNIFITCNVFENRSNNLFSNLSNQDYISSLNPIVSSQWITDINSNIYYLNGNVGIGTSTFNNDKLIINGSINTLELKLKGDNISNIFITSNLFETRSNLIMNETNNKFNNLTSNQFSTNGNNIFFNLTGNIGIGSTIPKEKLDINGNLNINGNIIPNSCNLFDLGSSNLKWKDLYISEIHLDNININSSNNLLNIKDDNNGDFIGINLNQIRLNSNNNFGDIKIDTNGDLMINNKFLVGLNNNFDFSNIIFSNVLLNSSNSLITSINDKYNSLNTDVIPIGSSNRFITNDIYNRNVNFTGIVNASNIIASNLNVIGDTAVFNTTIYQTEQLQIINDTTATAMIVKQINPNNNIAEFYYNNQSVNVSLSGTGNSINNVINDPNYKYAIFTSNGNFTIDKNLICDILVVGGGGGGGGGFGAGGGAGSLIYKTNYQLSSGTFNINIGSGGVGGNTSSGGGIQCSGTNGNDTTFINSLGTTIFNAKGGGGGGAWGSDTGKNGGSGGGSTNNSTAGTAVTTNIPQDVDVFGNAGGIGTIYSASIVSGGGGGGAGGVGNVGSTAGNGTGGNGGAGKLITITGNNSYYAGGGGGCVYKTSTIGTAGAGGIGGGGNGSASVSSVVNGFNGTANTGGGGGGASGPGGTGGIGGTGGTGVVIIRYLTISNNLGVVINSNGNIGIGVSNPQQKLEVSGTINTSAMNIGGVNLTTIITSNDTYNSNQIFANVSNYNYSISNFSYNSSNNLFNNKQDKLTSSSILLGLGSNISNINYSNLYNIPDLSVYITTTSLNTTSNNLYSNLSNIDFRSSNSNLIYSSNSIFGIIANNYQWTTTGNNISLNVSGNAGIGSTIPSEKIDINGNTNTNELFLKKSNISNIFITSNVFENRSNNSYSFLSNLDFNSSNNCISYTNIRTANLGSGGTNSSLYWLPSGTNIFTMSNVGIGTTNPQSKLDIIGDINFSGSLKMNNTTIPFSITSNTNITATNASFNNVNNLYGYYMFLTSGTITFPQATNCDLLLIGAGGNGGLTGGSGGGGSGELIYYPNYPFNVGTSNIQIGYSSFNSNNRITKISNNSIDYLVADGGGNGASGYNITITGSGNNIFTATDNNNFRYAFFANTGTFVANTNMICDILIIGGGGGGANRHASGGGAGALIYQTNISLNSGTYTINIGNGGAGNLFTASNGGDSSIILSGTTIYLAKGGAGGIGSQTTTSGLSGGSGSGGGGNATHAGGNPVNTNIANGVSGLTFGFAGGRGKGDNEGGAYWSGGGGGGAGGDGFSSTIESSRIRGGNGGIGRQISITGTATYYAGGGGGGLTSTGYGRTTGGLGGGGEGGISDGVSGAGANGTANTGGGAGGGGYNASTGGNGVGGTGGSGVVIIRYLYTTSTTGGSGGGSLLNLNNQSAAGSIVNPLYYFATTGLNGTATQGGSGGSVVNGGYTETITNTNLIIGTGGTGATASSVPVLKTTYGSGGDGNGGMGTQGLAIIKVPLNVLQPTFNGYVNYNNITNLPIFNNLLLSSNMITTNINNQVNFPNANVAWGNEWFLYIGTSPTSVINSFIFHHLTSTINSKWWFNGTTASTNAEISDERIKYEIQDIPDTLDKLMLLKPKEYYLCDEKDYLKKYGIIAQDVNNNLDLNHLVYNDIDYIANIYVYASYINEDGIYKLVANSSIINKINVDDELKLLLNNTNNIEIIIEDSPYNNRYKKRFVKVKSIIDEYSFEIYEDIELTFNERTNIFIYGKKVEDFKKLDYSSIYSLNIKATQELYKLIQHQQTIIENLKTRIIELENKI